MDEAHRVTPLSSLRRIIAARMTEATQTIPHFRLTAEIVLDALLQTRTQLRIQTPDVPLSLNDLLVKACAAALVDAPAVNIHWIDGQLHHFRAADISIVIAIEGGVAMPVLRNADAKSIWQIAREVRELSARARSNALRMTEIQGGTFSMSNLGMYGIDQFDAIISPPQCAILAIGCARQQCIVVNQEIRVATVMRATLSVDHRALDGAAAATFLSALRNRVENPEYLITADGV